MAGEGGRRIYWQFQAGVNVANGNLHLVLGSGSCVTCGGSFVSSVFPDPESKKLTGPFIVYNTLGTGDSDLGPKWMLPYHTSMAVAGNGDVTLTDADGTQRIFTKDATSTPQTYTADKERDVLTSDGTNYYLKRWDQSIWKFGFTSKTLDSITSRTTHVITIARDGNGRITTVTDGQGRVTKYFYRTVGSWTRLEERRELAPGDVGFQSTFLYYDSSGRLIQVQNPMGETTRFEYDSSNRLVKAIDGHGHATIYTYDSSSRVTNIEDPVSNDTVFAYPSSTTTNVTNRLGKTTVYTIDSSGRVTKRVDALSNEMEFAWDATTWELTQFLGPKIPVSGPTWKRHKEVYTYNTGVDKHELQKLELFVIDNTDTPSLLYDVEWTYNDQHEVLTYTDERNNVWTVTYKLDGSNNSIGHVLTMVNPESQTTLTNTYDTAGEKYRWLTTKNGVNKTTTFAYNQNSADSYGTPDKITAPSGAITNLKIDVRGRAHEVTPPSGNTTKIEFDALDRGIRRINPDGTARVSKFDCCHLSAEVDENGVGTSYEHDDLGRLAKTIDANGNETLRGYNAEGWLTSITDPLGNVTTKTYDDIGRLLQTDYPGGWQEIMTYFEPGHLKTLKTKKGASETTVTFVYDDRYRLIKKDFSSGTDTEFEWDPCSNLTKMKDASGEKRYTWDNANRLTKTVQGPTGFTEGTNENYKLEYIWNAASQCTQKKLTVRTQSAKTWDLAYTDDGQLSTVTNPDSEVTTHLYLTDGRLKKITLSTGSTRELFYQDTSDAHAYVAAKNSHLRKTLDKKAAGTVICSFGYELDPAGNRLSITDKDSKHTKFGLDPLYQLTSDSKWSAKVPGTREFQYGYAMDASGNRIRMHDDGALTSYTIGSNNELTGVGTETLGYDHFGNLASTSTSGWSLVYDFERHMTRISDESSNQDDHEYDGNGRRMRSKLQNAANWTNFIHDELTEEVLCEYTLISGTIAIKSLNTYGVGLISTNRESTKRYFHFDGLGSTAALTDGSEVVQDTYAYSAYGITEASTGSSVNPFRYVGQWGYYDDGMRGSAFGLLLLGIRYYKKEWGRFLVWDQRNTIPLYSYSQSQPTQLIDPSGRVQVNPFEQWKRDWDRHLDQILPKPKPGPQGIAPIYGKYCGPQSGDYAYSLKTPIHGRLIYPKATDALDGCCQDHDACWEAHGCNAANQFTNPKCRNCTKTLCICLLGANCNNEIACNVWRAFFAGFYACNPTFM